MGWEIAWAHFGWLGLGGKKIMVSDQQLTEHYRLYDLLVTSHAEYVDAQHQVNQDQVNKLKEVAQLVEFAWGILETPITISSGYRCPGLNSLVGSTIRSQHLLCEAADCVPRGIEVVDAFKKLRQAVKDKKLMVGQMIYEKATRSYGGNVTEWLHLSLGVPYRPKELCGEILTMNDGSYSLLEKILP